MKNKINTSEPGKIGWMASGGLAGGLAAFIGASCCVLPLILFNMGVSSAVIAQLGFFARYQSFFMALSVALVGLGTIIVFRRGNKPRKAVAIMLVFSLILVSLAYIMPYYERDLLILFGFRGQ